MTNIEIESNKVDKEARLMSEAAGKLLYPRDEIESGRGFRQLNDEVSRLSEDELKDVVAAAHRLHEDAYGKREQARREIVAATKGTDEDLDKARRNLSDKDMALRLTPEVEIVYDSDNKTLAGVKVSSGRRTYFVQK